MRDLHEFELAYVTGAGDSPTPPSEPVEEPKGKCCKKKIKIKKRGC